MPPEPNHKTDQALKAFAQKRREQAGPAFELDPAARRLLHQEVARGLSETRSAKPSAFFSGQDLWPRLLWGGSCVALLLIGAGVWLRVEHNREVQSGLVTDSNLFFFAQSATEQPGPAAPTGSSEATTMADRVRGFEIGASTSLASAAHDLKKGQVPPARDASRVDLALTMPTTRELADQDLFSNAAHFQLSLPGQNPALAASAKPEGSAVPALAASAPPPIQEGEERSAERLGREVVRGDQAAPAPQSSQQLVRATPAKRSGFGATAAEPSRDEAEGLVRYFEQADPQQRYRRNLNSPPAPKLLTTFQMQRAGDNVRIVDADGSVYDGSVRPIPAQQPRPDLAQPVAFRFQTVGTNVTLKQRVTFSGEFNPQLGEASAPPAPSAAPAEPVKESAGRLTKASASTGRAQQQLSVAGKIEGTAAVGNVELKIEAQEIAK